MVADRIKVTSLGLFILDTFEFTDLETGIVTLRSDSVIGGGGPYTILGSRIWLGANEVGLLIDRGNDWDQTGVEEKLDQFGKAMWYYRAVKDRETTRALNKYSGQLRAFEYLNGKTPLEPIDLPTNLQHAQFMHLVCSPARTLAIVGQLSSLSSTARLVYEPIPISCRPEEFPDLRKVLPYLYVFSPNHDEISAFYSISPAEVHTRGKVGVEEIARKFIDEEGCVCWIVIRSGALGCYLIKKGKQGKWIDAYHTTSARVEDVTGAGNSFLGGLMAGMTLENDNDGDEEMVMMTRACRMGSISASFIIEQWGLPKFTTAGSIERWNDEIPHDRLIEMESR